MFKNERFFQMNYNFSIQDFDSLWQNYSQENEVDIWLYKLTLDSENAQIFEAYASTCLNLS